MTLVNGDSSFLKPVDRIGDKSILNNDRSVYPVYADDHIYEVNIPGCSGAGRVFVGQRREGFVINVGEIFDLFNLNPLAARDSKLNDLAGKSITTLALESPDAVPGQARSADHRRLDDCEPSRSHSMGRGLPTSSRPAS